MKKISIFVATLLIGTICLKSQIPNYVSPTDLVAWYNFSGDSSDASGNNNDLVNTSAVATTDRNGQPNSAYYFNGNAYLTKSTISQIFTVSGAYSISFWTKKDNAGVGIAIMSGNSIPSNFVWTFQGMQKIFLNLVQISREAVGHG